MSYSDEENSSPPGDAAAPDGGRLPSIEEIPPERSATEAAQSWPEDLRISWSWIHFVVFLFFSIGSLFFVQLALTLYLASARRLTMKQIEQTLTTRAPYVVGQQVVLFGLLMLFLWVTLSVLRQAPFWRTMGWRPLVSSTSAPRAAWRYFLFGCGLAIFVAVAGYRFQPKDKLPIQELFKDRTGALLVMGMAVLVAPLVEETLFRGYLYPLFARKFGVPAGIAVTGALFGMLHGAQLGWTWSLVGLLTLVGVILTYARARTRTVVASYLLHLGYNSMIALATIIGTHGFRSLPAGP